LHRFWNTVKYCLKIADLNLPDLYFALPFGVTLSEFCRDLWWQKTGVHGLSYGIVCMILCLALLVQCRLVTDRQTCDDSIYCTGIALHVKNQLNKNWMCTCCNAKRFKSLSLPGFNFNFWKTEFWRDRFVQRLVVCLEESLYVHNIRDMKVLHTIRDTPPNPAGICCLSANNDNCYLAYPGSNQSGGVEIFDTVNLVCHLYLLTFQNSL